ncbi:uncharacterized protein LOC115172822 isoform X2 [Salmo trutta]|uniref:uncharacterized protein LOC115172822 isoform X2 n=1 Tax=Salmo trutta TaxID=8032 RepID=UPI001131384A|nr:uncharacterized protein LOC115172822 isoform X2 [Salmo trutta]
MAASGLHTPSGDSLHLSELRIVLLGYRGGSGKSSAGNTILGREEFDLKTTAQCVKRQREVAGRQVTVVDTPGWWKNLPVERTPELVKQEILLSVSLCPPGPHTFLLVISVGFLYTEEDRRAVEEHLTLLSEKVWSHTIVLFTRGDCLGDTTIEQHIQREGEALQWLVEKCGNRYHVLNNENRGDVTQVTELLAKIEETVAGNRGHFEIKRELLEKIEVWRRKKEDKAKQLCMRVKKQREIHRTFIGDYLHLSELRIVLLGSRDAGKSSAGNTILGREEFDLRTATQCVKRQGEVAGRQVTVVDTPGWSKNLPVEYTPELVKQEIVFSVSLCPPGPHTLLLVIRVDVSFKEEETNAAEDHLELLSERVWSHTIVLFTHGDCLGDTTIEQHIQREGKALQWLVEKCGNRYHVLNNENKGDVTQVTELLEKIDELVAANSGDVFYPERDCEEGMNWIPEEMWEKPSLPLKGAHSIYPLLLSMSGGSRPETGYDGSEQMSGVGSVAESLLRLVVPGEYISDTQSLRSSVYSSQTSEPVCEHNSSLDFMSSVVRSIFCSQKNPFTSDTSNPESEHSSTSTPAEHTLAVVTKLTPETSIGFTEMSCRLQCSHAGLFQCSLTGLVFLMKGKGEVLYRTVQWDENLLHSTGQTPAGPLFSIECLQGSICQLHLPHCEILSGEGLDSLSVAHVTGDSVEVLPPLRVTDTHVVVNITDLSLWGLVRMFKPFLSIKGQVLPFLQSFGHPQSVLNVIVLPSNVPLNEVKQQQTGNTYIPVCSDCTLSRGGKYSLSCDLKKIQDIYPKAKRIQIYWDYGPNYHPTFQVFLNPDTEHVELRLLERGADGHEVWAGRVLLPGSVLVGRDQAENSHSDSAEKQLHSVRKDFVDRVSKSVVDDLLDGLLQQKVINNHEMETVKVIPERAEKAREVIDMVLRKGAVSCLIMKTLLVELDPFLCTTLGFS